MLNSPKKDLRVAVESTKNNNKMTTVTIKDGKLDKREKEKLENEKIIVM